MKVLPGILALLLAIGGPLAPAHGAEGRWVDSVSMTVGMDDNSNNTDVYRLGRRTAGTVPG